MLQTRELLTKLCLKKRAMYTYALPKIAKSYRIFAVSKVTKHDSQKLWKHPGSLSQDVCESRARRERLKFALL